LNTKIRADMLLLQGSWRVDHVFRTDLYTILKILSLTLFERTSLIQMVINDAHTTEGVDTPNQLDLLDNLTGQ